MTETRHRGAPTRRGRERRLLAAGVLACSAVLLPVGTASAQEMAGTMADGMMCPHAVGDISNPATAAPPTRSAPNEAPLAAKPAAVSAPARPAASQAPARPAASTTGASQPAVAQAKSTAGAGAAAPVASTRPASVPAPQPQRATVPVAQPQRTPAPVARPAVAPDTERATPKRTAPARTVVAPKVTTTVIPDVTRPSAGNAPQAAAAQAVEESPGIGRPIVLGGLLLLSAFVVAVVIMRRRRSGGEAIAMTPDEPLEPALLRPEADEVDEFEVALREWVSEARARELLGGDQDEPADAGRPFASR